MNTPGFSSRAGLVLLFFISGFSGLIYQVVWVRWLTMYVGGSAFAVGTILTLFMGGLAWGSLLAARRVDRVRSPGGLIRMYGGLELGIGVFALVFPLLFEAARPLYAALYRQFSGSLLAYNALSALVSIGLLIVPTILMGATLPYLSRYCVTRPTRTGTGIGWLYGVNTLGAALGALVCGFWMIRALGVVTTVYVAAALNLLIGLACLAWSWRMSAAPDLSLPTESRPAHPAIAGWTGIAAVLATSGFCAMAYEVIWTKLIALLVGPTTYSFTIVLVSFITGLALGSLLFGWICDRVRSPTALLYGTQIGAAALALATSHFLGNSQVFFSRLLVEFRADFASAELAKAGVLFLAMLPPTLLLGAVFPISVRIFADRLESLGSSVGRLYAVNTLGALLGAAAAAFLMVPLLGQSRSLMLLAALQGLGCLAVAIVREPRGARSLALPVAATAGLLLLCTRLPDWDMAHLATAQYYRFDNKTIPIEHVSYWDALVKGPALRRRDQLLRNVLSVEDGIDGFVAVSETVNALGQTNRVLSVSGKTDASSMSDLSTEALSGHIPMLLHPQPETALVIGLASGITAGEMLHYPLERLDILEISPEVARACAAFSPWNNGVLENARARVIVQDARAHLTLSDARYDVIISEPSNPWMAGVANLFTQDFFLKVRAHLKPGGVFVQWFHTYENDWDTFAIFGRGLTTVFPNSILMRTTKGYNDCLFVCFEDAAATLDFETIARNLAHAAQSPHVRIASPQLLAQLVVAENLQELFGEGPLHTDARPVLEYLAPRNMARGDPAGIARTLAERGQLGERTAAALEDLRPVARQIDYAEFLAAVLLPPFGAVELDRAASSERERYAACLAAYASRDEMGIATLQEIPTDWEREVCLTAQEAGVRRELARRSESGASAEDRAHCHFALGNIAIVREDYPRAEECYLRCIELVPDLVGAQQNLKNIYERSGRHEQAAEILNGFLAQGPVTPGLLADLASNAVDRLRMDEAREFLDRALELDPRHVPTLIVAATIYGRNNELERSIHYAARATLAAPRDSRGHALLAAGLLRSGRLKEAQEAIQRGLAILPGDPQLVELQSRLPSAPQDP